MTITTEDIRAASLPRSATWGHFGTLEEAQTEANQYRGSCLDGFCGSYMLDAMDNGDRGVSWATIYVGGGLWDYRKPYVQELCDLFEPIFGYAAIHRPSKRHAPRVIFRIEEGNYREPVHAFNVALRYSYAHIRRWPLLDAPPDAKTLSLTLLEYDHFDNYDPNIYYGFTINY